MVYKIITLVPKKLEDKVANKVKSDERSKNKLLTQFDNVETNEIINKALAHILKKHRNTKIFLILMGKWFFIGYWIIKLIIKVGIIYYVYKKR